MKPVIGITCDMDEQIFRLRQDYVSAVSESGGLPVILASPPFNSPLSKGTYPPASPLSKGGAEGGDVNWIADMVDGLLLPGGDDLWPEYYGEDISVPLEILKFARKERSDFEITLLRETIRRNKPVLAVCYGMQLVNAAFGGSLYQDIEMQIKDTINHKTGQHAIKIEESFCSKFDIPQSAICNRQFVNSSHHQAIKRLADGFEVFALSDDGIIEGFYKKDYPFFVSVQWHPERIFYDKLSLGIFKSFIRKAM